MESTSKVIVAFDFGLKNIGLAIGQEVTRTAQTFYSLSAINGEPEWSKLDELIEEWQPKLFVVGKPLNMDGTESKIQKKSYNFSLLLSKRYSIPVELIDERLTTREARERLSCREKSLISFSDDVHETSAQIILENWFEENK
tara:strand:- start:898 stop:1323 length:426 start_codon:yes stop_codon:yes gene_type:complete